MIVVRRGKGTTVVQGEITFSKGYRIVLKERLSLTKSKLSLKVMAMNFGGTTKKFHGTIVNRIPTLPILQVLTRITNIFKWLAYNVTDGEKNTRRPTLKRRSFTISNLLEAMLPYSEME